MELNSCWSKDDRSLFFEDFIPPLIDLFDTIEHIYTEVGIICTLDAVRSFM